MLVWSFSYCWPENVRYSDLMYATASPERCNSLGRKSRVFENTLQSHCILRVPLMRFGYMVQVVAQLGNGLACSGVSYK